MEWVEIHDWVLVAHVFGFVMWVGSLIGALHVLGAHSVADGGHKAFEDLEKSLGIAADVGATLTIASGLYLALGGPLNFFVKNDVDGAFMHVKVTLVALGLLGLHGFVRVKIKKFRNGKVAPIPKALFPVLMLVVLSIIILILVRPF